jgi:hypothetical protein
MSWKHKNKKKSMIYHFRRCQQYVRASQKWMQTKWDYCGFLLQKQCFNKYSTVDKFISCKIILKLFLK